MIYSHSLGLTWIIICSVLSVAGERGDGSGVTSSFGNSSENLDLNENKRLMTRSALLDRNVRELRELYLSRERKEKEDPMNYLSKLYSSMEESRKFVPFKMDDFDDGFLDPPQVELQFHKKVPNCGSIFNITKIMELVDEDKRQRACCPCSWSRQSYQINYCKPQVNLGNEISNISLISLSSPSSSAKTPKVEPPSKSPTSRKGVEKEKTKTAAVQKPSQAVQRSRPELPGRVSPEGRRIVQKAPSVQLKNVNVKHGSDLSLSAKHPHGSDISLSAKHPHGSDISLSAKHPHGSDVSLSAKHPHGSDISLSAKHPHKPSLKSSKNVVGSAAKSQDMSKPPNYKQFLSNVNQDLSKLSTIDRGQAQLKQI